MIATEMQIHLGFLCPTTTIFCLVPHYSARFFPFVLDTSPKRARKDAAQGLGKGGFAFHVSSRVTDRRPVPCDILPSVCKTPQLKYHGMSLAIRSSKK